MKQQLIKLFEYNHWANRKFGEVLESSTFNNPKILTLISHTLNAQMIWMDRVNGKESKTKVWEEYSIKDAIEMLLANSEEWLEMLKNEEGYERMVNYRNSLGVAHSSVFSDIATHVANHGTHHRGQIAVLLREENIDPPASDFIFFSRD